MAVNLRADEARSSLDGLECKVKIAAINSPSSVTLSGEPKAIEDLSQTLASQGVFTRILPTGGNAYHSHHMLALGKLYEEQATEGLNDVKALTENEPPAPLLKWISSVTMQEEKGSPLPEYSRRNLESPVLFSPVVERLAIEEPLDLLIEIGPHPALGGPLKQIRSSLGKSGVVLPPCLASLRRGEDDVVSMLTLAGNLFITNAPVDLVSVNATVNKIEADGTFLLHHGSPCIDLFQYPYSYPEVPVYFENRLNKEYRTRKHPRHDLLGARVPACSRTHPQWRNVLRLKDLPWLSDHKLLPYAVLPGAAYITMAVEAVTQLHYDAAELAGAVVKIKSFKLRQVAINSALRVEDTELGVETVLNMEKVALTNAPFLSQWYRFSIGSMAANSEIWTEHCTGMVCVMTTETSIDEDQRLEVDARSRSLDMTRWYERFAAAGLGYGPAFQGLSKLQAYRSTNTAAANVALKPTINIENESTYAVHPATLDTCIQLALISCHAGQVENLNKAFVPVFADNVCIWNSESHDAKEAWGVAHGSLVGLRSAYARVQLYGTSSTVPLLDIGELKCVTYDGAPDTDGSKIAREPYWRPVARIDSDTLTARTAGALFNPIRISPTILAALDTLSAHIIANIEDELQKEGTIWDKTRNHNGFFDWIKAWISSAEREEVHSVGREADRFAIIEELATKLCEVPEAKCLKTLHDNIDRVLGGDTNSFRMLMENNLLTELSTSGVFVKGAYLQLQGLVDLLAHKNPRMRILEVGVGSAGATAAVLETLSAKSIFKRFAEYVLTDSAGWCLSNAKARFSDCGGGLVFQTLDILKDPISQGFEEHSFDLIIAAGCLVELHSPASGLEHLHTLLNPSGSLILVETTRSALALEILCRTLTGNWHQEALFKTAAEWNDILNGCGFSDIIVSLKDVSTSPSPLAPAGTCAPHLSSVHFYVLDSI